MFSVCLRFRQPRSHSVPYVAYPQELSKVIDSNRMCRVEILHNEYTKHSSAHKDMHFENNMKVVFKDLLFLRCLIQNYWRYLMSKERLLRWRLKVHYVLLIAGTQTKVKTYTHATRVLFLVIKLSPHVNVNRTAFTDY